MEIDDLRAAVGVRFLELEHSHVGLKADLVADFADLIDSNEYVNGRAVAEFETAFASWCGAAHCVGLASGLDAVRFGLLAAGVGPGDEVVLPANTFIATAEAVTQAGAKPVLVDVLEDDLNIDPMAVEAAVGPKTRCLLPVHLYGQLADMRGLLRVAARHQLKVVEDACQAHGARRDGIGAGRSGTAAAFSFYPGKNLGAMGDAGALVTSDEEVGAATRMLREHGQSRKYHHAVVGYTARLDTIQALVLLRKLDRLDDWNEQRRSAAAFYNEALADVGDLRLPPVPEGSDPVWHLYVVRTRDPEALAAKLGSAGVGTGRHYPEPIHLSPAYAHLGYRRGAFPVTEALADECLSLPIFPGISEAQLEAVTGAVEAAFRG